MPPTTPTPSLSNIFKLFGIAIKLMLISLAILLAGAVMFKDFVIRTAGAQVASSVLGAPVHMGYFSWGFMNQKIVINDLVIGHPPGFEEGGFLEISKAVVEYDLGAFLKGQMRMPLVVVDLRQMTVIKSAEGPLNVDSLKVIQADKKEKFEVPAFQIDELRLSIGRVVYKDHFKKKKPQILVYDINMKNKSFKNINNVPKLMTVVVVQALKPTAIHSAGVYAAATLLGVGFLPGAVLGIVVAKDDAIGELGVGLGRAFDMTVQFVKDHGRLTRSDKAKGIVDGSVQGMDVKIRLEKISWFKTRITVAARKFMLPKKEFAAGILYQIGQKLSPRNSTF
jgi:hypothetical protein